MAVDQIDDRAFDEKGQAPYGNILFQLDVGGDFRFQVPEGQHLPFLLLYLADQLRKGMVSFFPGIEPEIDIR